MSYGVQKYRAERKAHGECILCGYPNPDKKHATCPKCRDRMKKEAERKREERRANGLCIYCGKKPALPGKNECGCRSAYIKQKRERNMQNGLCTICGKRPVDGVRSKKMCSDCLDRHAAYTKRWLIKKTETT